MKREAYENREHLHEIAKVDGVKSVFDVGDDLKSKKDSGSEPTNAMAVATR